MKKIIISEFMELDSVESMKSNFDVLYAPDLFQNRKDLINEVRRCDALIVRNQTRVDAELLQEATQLKVVGRLGVGLDNIDTALCESLSVAVIPATGANANAVAEYVLTSAFLLLRLAYQASPEVMAGQWPRQRLSQGRELGGKVLGLIGFGQIAQELARKAKALGMQVIAFDPYVSAQDPAVLELGVSLMSLEQLLGQADVVSLHIPLNDSTAGLLSMAQFKQMKSDALLVNTARGGIVDEQALCDALKNGVIAGAAIDVFEHEPLQASPCFTDVPNLILTPHIAGVTMESNRRISQLIAERVSGYLRHEG